MTELCLYPKRRTVITKLTVLQDLALTGNAPNELFRLLSSSSCEVLVYTCDGVIRNCRQVVAFRIRRVGKRLNRG